MSIPDISSAYESFYYTKSRRACYTYTVRREQTVGPVQTARLTLTYSENDNHSHIRGSDTRNEADGLGIFP